MMVDTPTGYRFLRGTDGDTALIYDSRSGYTQLVPGAPGMADPPRSSDPACDMRVRLTELPVDIRWRVDGVGTSAQPQALASALATSYAGNRTDADQVHTQPAHPAQLARWGADGAASTLYPLRQLSEDGADMEELLVIVRGPYAVHQTRLFTRITTDPQLWARMVSACAGGIHWLPRPPTSVPPLWPGSTFVAPGLRMTLLPARMAQVAKARADAPTATARCEAITQRLQALMRGGEAPATPIGPAELSMYDQYLADTLEGTGLLPHAQQWMCDAQNAHDIRGVCTMLLATLPPLGNG